MLKEILEKYKDQEPMDFGTATERCYPVSAVIKMMEEYHESKINKFALGDVSKSVCSCFYDCMYEHKTNYCKIIDSKCNFETVC